MGSLNSRYSNNDPNLYRCLDIQKPWCMRWIWRWKLNLLLSNSHYESLLVYFYLVLVIKVVKYMKVYLKYYQSLLTTLFFDNLFALSCINIIIFWYFLLGTSCVREIIYNKRQNDNKQWVPPKRHSQHPGNLQYPISITKIIPTSPQLRLQHQLHIIIKY